MRASGAASVSNGAAAGAVGAGTDAGAGVVDTRGGDCGGGVGVGFAVEFVVGFAATVSGGGCRGAGAFGGPGAGASPPLGIATVPVGCAARSPRIIHTATPPAASRTTAAVTTMGARLRVFSGPGRTIRRADPGA